MPTNKDFISFNDTHGNNPAKKQQSEPAPNVPSQAASSPYTGIESAATPGQHAICKTSIPDLLKDWLSRRQVWGFFVSVAVMALLALIFFMPANFDGKSLSQHDMIQGIANGQETLQYQEETGEKSYWTNSLFGGMPTFQISPTYPSDSLFRWIHSVYGLGLPSPSNLLFMMMMGFMILMMAMNVRWEYGLIGAIAWGLSSYFIIIIGAGHIWKFEVLAYIPPTIGGIMLAYRGRYIAGCALTAIFGMMQLISNHIQMSYYFSFLVLLLMVAFLVEACREKKLKQWFIATGVVAGAAILAVCANLPNLYHTWKFSSETQRAGSELAVEGENAAASSEQSREYITHYSYRKGETFTLLIPNFNGGATFKIKEGKNSLAALSDLDGAKEYQSDPILRDALQSLPQYFGEHDQSTSGPVYVGAIICLLFVVGCVVVRGPLKWALLGGTLLSIALAWGKNFMGLTDLFLDLVPMYNKFRTPESILVVAEFTMPLLAILGLQKLITDREALKANLRKLTVIFGCFAAVLIVVALFPSVAGDPTIEDENATEENLARYEQGLNAQVPEYVNALVAQGFSLQEAEAYAKTAVKEELSDVTATTVLNPEVRQAAASLRKDMVSSDAFRSLIFVALAFAMLVLYIKGTIAGYAAVAAVGLLITIDLYTVDKRFLNEDSFSKQLQTATAKIEPTQGDKKILADKDINFRVFDMNLFDARSSYFHKTVGGYFSAKLKRTNDLVNSELIKNPSVLAMLNTKWLYDNGQAELMSEAIPGYRPLGNAWFVNDINYVDDARSEFNALSNINDFGYTAVADKQFADILGQPSFSTGGKVKEVSYAPNHLVYESESPSDGIVVFSEIYFPWGWEATIDGQPAEIGRVDYLLRALRVPAGSHKIEMTFKPQSVSTTNTVAVIAVILTYLLALLAIGGYFFSFAKRNCAYSKA